MSLQEATGIVTGVVHEGVTMDDLKKILSDINTEFCEKILSKDIDFYFKERINDNFSGPFNVSEHRLFLLFSGLNINLVEKITLYLKIKIPFTHSKCHDQYELRDFSKLYTRQFNFHKQQFEMKKITEIFKLSKNLTKKIKTHKNYILMDFYRDVWEDSSKKIQNWTKSGCCPHCGELGKIIGFGFVCSKHGVYS